jgi:hypothetical protein
MPKKTMTKQEMVAKDARALSRRSKPTETQGELLRGAAQSLRNYADTFDSRQPALERQIAMCEKAADDVERLAESLRLMATPP